MEIDYAAVGEKIKAGYRLVTAQYRRDDEIEVTTENHRHLGRILKQICLSFPRPIAVLDAGCGTGRYFHCLHNTARLVGLDISEDMLAAAKNPVLGKSISVGRVELIQGNVYLCPFPPESFDFIYSLGMFGHGCPVTVEICNQFHSWLRPGGKLFFNVVDMAGLPLSARIRRRLRALIYPFLRGRCRKLLDERERLAPFFGLTKGQLRRILAATRFRDFHLTSYPCQSPLWCGRHLECLAAKTANSGASP